MNNSEILPAGFDRKEFEEQLANAIELIPEARQISRDLYKEGIRKIAFVGCGAPYRIMNILKSWVDQMLPDIVVENYLPAEFIDLDPSFVDKETVVVLGSYSGTTKETVDAAKFCNSKGVTSVAITRFEDSPLGKKAAINLNFGDVKLGDYSRFIVSTAFTSEFLSMTHPDNWEDQQAIIDSLKLFPEVLSEVVYQSEPKVREVSEKYNAHKSMFIVGHGSMFNTAYVLAFCSFMEMQWIHATPVIGAEFFHGPFELLDDTFPTFVLIGEDATRPQGERIRKFCEKHLEKFIVFDTKDYDLDGIPDKLRAFYGPIVLDAATRRLMDYFAALSGHDKSKRRYMGVVSY